MSKILRKDKQNIVGRFVHNQLLHSLACKVLAEINTCVMEA